MPNPFDSVQSPLERSDQVAAPQSLAEETRVKLGKVYLVGAGPGDPGLITVRGAQCLAQAEVVLYDALANPDLLALAPQATHISVGKHGHGPLWSQSEICEKMVELARLGHRVVRLKGGDPAVFARTAEELDALSVAQIPFEVVPGITAALAAASYTGIPITHRDFASAVAFVTGQQQSGDYPADLDWDALARFPGTLVFYMGVTTASKWSQRLIESGKSPTTPAAIVRRCSWTDQTVIRCCLADVAAELTPANKLRPPVIVIIGEVAKLGCDWNWFDQLPLRGIGVLLTRPAGQNDSLEDQLRTLGAEVFVQPALEILPPSSFDPLDQALKGLRSNEYQGVAFTSSNAVDAVFDRMETLGLDCRVFAGVTVAVVGERTAAHLALRGLRADWIPHHFSAVGLLEHMGQQVGRNWKQESWLLPQASRAASTLAEGIEALGAKVERVIAYRSEPVTSLHPAVKDALDRRKIRWAMVSSAAGAEGIAKLLKPWLRDMEFLSWSPAISEKLRQMEIDPACQSPLPTAESALATLLGQLGIPD